MKILNYIKNNKVISALLGLSLLFNIYTLNENALLSQDYTNVATDYNELVEEYNGLLEENQKLEKDKKELQGKVEQAKPWFEMKEEERKAEEERLAKEKAEREERERQEQERLEQEKLAKEKAEQEERERKEKQGYESGITYDQLARNPQEYKGEKVKFSGKVLQVMESDSYTAIRLGVNGSYNNVIFLVIPNSLMEQRILEDDYITVYGVSSGIYTYTTVLGAEMSIPSMKVDKIG